MTNYELRRCSFLISILKYKNKDPGLYELIKDIDDTFQKIFCREYWSEEESECSDTSSDSGSDKNSESDSD